MVIPPFFVVCRGGSLSLLPDPYKDGRDGLKNLFKKKGFLSKKTVEILNPFVLFLIKKSPRREIMDKTWHIIFAMRVCRD
jgi:hypothetical protein